MRERCGVFQKASKAHPLLWHHFRAEAVWSPALWPQGYKRALKKRDPLPPTLPAGVGAAAACMPRGSGAGLWGPGAPRAGGRRVAAGGAAAPPLLRRGGGGSADPNWRRRAAPPSSSRSPCRLAAPGRALTAAPRGSGSRRGRCCRRVAAPRGEAGRAAQCRAGSPPAPTPLLLSPRAAMLSPGAAAVVKAWRSRKVRGKRSRGLIIKLKRPSRRLFFFFFLFLISIPVLSVQTLALFS